VPKRTFWLATGVAIGAGSSLWAERKIRQGVQQAAARLQPDAVVVEVGRSARQVADSAGSRVRDALASGRSEMQRREEELWSELAVQGVEVPPPPSASPSASPSVAAPPDPRRSAAGDDADLTAARRPRRRRNPTHRRAKSPSHLDK